MKVSLEKFIDSKKTNKIISMVTAYDFPAARILNECGVDIVLVGDSLGPVVLGYEQTSQVTMQDMIHHVKAVSRGAGQTFVLADMPFASIDTNESAYDNAKALIDAGADAVKMEGGISIAPMVKFVVDRAIAVCAHIGYMPQTAARPGLVGKTFEEAKQLVEAALALQNAGASMIVLELIPQNLAKEISVLLTIPTIGIGAGVHCNGQVQVFHDMLGLSPRTFKHVKNYGNGNAVFGRAISNYISEVQTNQFPTIANASTMSEDILLQIKDWIHARKQM